MEVDEENRTCFEDDQGNPLRLCNQKPGQTRGEAMMDNLRVMEMLLDARYDPRFFGVLCGQE